MDKNSEKRPQGREETSRDKIILTVFALATLCWGAKTVLEAAYDLNAMQDRTPKAATNNKVSGRAADAPESKKKHVRIQVEGDTFFVDVTSAPKGCIDYRAVPTRPGGPDNTGFEEPKYYSKREQVCAMGPAL